MCVYVYTTTHMCTKAGEVVLLTAGQAEQWSDAVQDVLATAHLQLNTLYLGLEDAAAAKMYRHVSVLPDQQPSVEIERGFYASFPVGT